MKSGRVKGWLGPMAVDVELKEGFGRTKGRGTERVREIIFRKRPKKGKVSCR